LQVKRQIAVFLLFYAATNVLGGSPKLSLSPGTGNPKYATASSAVCVLRNAFMSVLQHDTSYVVVFNFVQTSTKKFF